MDVSYHVFVKKGTGKTLILVRHAHRDTADRLLDNGLSEKGFKQVRLLEKELFRHFGVSVLKKWLFFSSPKRRCIETVFPLSTVCRTGLKIEPFLDEQAMNERHSDFKRRVNFALRTLTHLDADVLCCSHGDWIPEALKQLTGKTLEIRKGACVVLHKTTAKHWIISDTILTES